MLCARLCPILYIGQPTNLGSDFGPLAGPVYLHQWKNPTGEPDTLLIRQQISGNPSFCSDKDEGGCSTYPECNSSNSAFGAVKHEVGNCVTCGRLLSSFSYLSSTLPETMAAPQLSINSTSIFLTTHRGLVDALTSFLTVSVHHVLFLRRIYPPVSFLAVRAYNYPVRQSRHPAVCTWIDDAIAAVRDQVEKNTVETVAVCIFETETNSVLERWTFDLRSFPVIEKKDRDVGSQDDPDPSVDDDEDTYLSQKINVVELEAQFRAVLSRISVSAAKLRPLPERAPDAPECSFTVVINVHDEADRPVGRLEKEERHWIPAEPAVFEDDSDQLGGGEDEETSKENRMQKTRKKTKLQGKTIPVRRLEAGELRMEVWIEESQAKLDLSARVQSRQDSGRPSHSPNHQSFDAERGVALEPADVNRKPQGGAFSDYKR